MIAKNTVQDLYDFLNTLAPFSAQLPWDNSGFLIGDPAKEVRTCVLAMDVTSDVIHYAESVGAQLIITHHPVIFAPIKRVTADSNVYKLIRADVSVISAHTNLDLAEGGVNDTLAEALGLTNIRPFENEDNIGRIGDLPETMNPADFAVYVKEKLGITADVAYVGENPVKTVALIGGAGSDYIADAVKAGADAYVTGEVKHHEWMAAQEMNITVVSAGHHATEDVVFAPLIAKFAEKFPETKFLPYTSCKVKSV